MWRKLFLIKLGLELLFFPLVCIYYAILVFFLQSDRKCGVRFVVCMNILGKSDLFPFLFFEGVLCGIWLKWILLIRNHWIEWFSIDCFFLCGWVGCQNTTKLMLFVKHFRLSCNFGENVINWFELDW